ncbi:34328_t:CDS:2, partial [Racocetra persica]
VHFIEFSSENYGGLKHNRKYEMEQKVDNNMVMKKLVKINGQAAEASISTGLSINLISINYVKKQGLTWRRLKEGLTIGYIDNKVIGCISDIDVAICGVGVHCNITWKNEKYRYTIRSGYNKATFVIPEESMSNKIMVDEEYAINDKVKKNRIVSKMNEKNINRNGPDKKHIPDIQMVDNKDLKDYRCKFECIDKTVKSSVIDVKFDKLNQKNETKIRIIPEGSHKRKVFEHHQKLCEELYSYSTYPATNNTNIIKARTTNSQIYKLQKESSNKMLKTQYAVWIETSNNFEVYLVLQN